MTMISVAIPTFNGMPYFSEQIESILNQTRRPDEIVISDDGSTDGTYERALELESKYEDLFTVIRNEGGRGVAENYSNAIQSCSGDVIQLCDQDDLWLPHKIETLLESYRTTSAGFLCHDAEIVSNDLSTLGRLWSRSNISTAKFSSEKDIFERLIYGENFIQGASIFADAHFLKCQLPLLSHRYDYYLAVCGSLIAGIEPVDEVLSKYRQHDNQDLGAPGATIAHRMVKSLQRNPLSLQSETMRMWKQLDDEITATNDSDLRVSKEYALAKIRARLDFERKRHQVMNRQPGTLSAFSVLGRTFVSGDYHRYGKGTLTAARDYIQLLTGV